MIKTEYQYGESFQQRLLALYIRDPQATYLIIEPSYFTNPVHMDVARLIKEVYDSHNRNEVKISLPTLMAMVKGFLGEKRSELWPGYRKTIRHLFEDDLFDRSIILQQALGFAKQRKFRQALIGAEKDINNQKYDRAIERFSDLKNFGIERDLGIEYWKDPTDPRRWYEERDGIVPTHYIPTLDKLMGGGLGGGELGIILAGGKAGKSTILARAAAGAIFRGKNVAIATGELSGKKYQKRIDAMITMTPSWKLSQLVHADEEDYKEIAERLRRVQKRMKMSKGIMRGQLWIKQYPTGRGRVSDIEAWLHNLKEAGVKIDALYADYIRVFRPNRETDDQRLNIGQVCMDLRGLATEENIPVWTASQTTRAALSKEVVGPEDIAEDISQFWTLDFLVALCQTKQESESKPYQKARLLLTAARDVGRGGIVDVSMERETFRVWERLKREGKNDTRR